MSNPATSGSERQQRAVEQALAHDEERRREAAWAAVREREAAAAPAPRRPAPPESPIGLIVSGGLMLLVGGVLLGLAGALRADSVWLAVIALVAAGALALVGQVMVLIGVIAAGVRLGMRWHRHEGNSN